MSDFDKKTCATAIAATVADLSQNASEEEGQPGSACSEELSELSEPLARCWQSLIHPLLLRMDEHVDCRLVKTLERTILSVLQHRNRATGLPGYYSRNWGPLSGPRPRSGWNQTVIKPPPVQEVES